MNHISDIVPQEILDKLAKMIKETKFGSVTIIIQDSHIVQIDKNEKLRLK
jgi:hypothetical protein